MYDQLDLFKEENNKVKLPNDVQSCRKCKELKPSTMEYFRVDRWCKSDDYTLCKTCKKCESKYHSILHQLRKKHIHKLTENYKCPLCLRNEEEVNHKLPWVLDHDHDTNEFRGWICNRCNVGLRTIEITERTLKYLKGELDVT